MKRRLLDVKKRVSTDGFRYRGLETTRLENLSDAVFGFAITLLVISSQVPTSYEELQVSMYGFLGFIFCTMLLLVLWNDHAKFFLHYGLVDRTIKTLNALFLFVLLFYVYPLKYLFSLIGTILYIKLIQTFDGQSEATKSAVIELEKMLLTSDQWSDLMLRFGLGLFFIFLILLFMHWHVLRKADELSLNRIEKYITRTFIQENLLACTIAVISIMTVWYVDGSSALFGGMVYLLIPFVDFFHKKKRKKGLKKIRELT